MKIKCDFCCDELELALARRYEANDFVPRTDPGLKMESAWAACSACADLIDAGKYRALTERSVDEFFKHHPGATVPREVALLLIGDLHREFREHRRNTNI